MRPPRQEDASDRDAEKRPAPPAEVVLLLCMQRKQVAAVFSQHYRFTNMQIRASDNMKPRRTAQSSSDLTEKVVYLPPSLTSNTRRTPKHIIGVDSALDLEKAWVVVAPESTLPVRFVSRSLQDPRHDAAVSDCSTDNCNVD